MFKIIAKKNGVFELRMNGQLVDVSHDWQNFLNTLCLAGCVGRG